MSYNTELQSNNADLQEILDAVNALPDAGAELPELTNPGTAGDLVYGKEMIDANGNVVTGSYVPLDTSDATATAEQMAQGATAYVNGEKITGAIYDTGTNATSYIIDELSSFAGGTVLQLSGTKSADVIIRAGSKIKGNISAQKFGDAAAADVAKGKTFTSAAGLLAVGTREESGGIETVQVTVSVFGWEGFVWYTDANYSFQSLYVSGSATYEITCLKNSPVIFSGYGFAPSIEADYEIPYEEDMSDNGMYVYHFTEDCNILIEAPGGGIEEPEA